MTKSLSATPSACFGPPTPVSIRLAAPHIGARPRRRDELRIGHRALYEFEEVTGQMSTQSSERRDRSLAPVQPHEKPSMCRDGGTRSEALASVARRQHEPLLRFLARRAGSLSEAEDIVQEAYVRVLSVKRRDAIQSLDRYLWRSAMNIAADHARSRQTRRRLAESHLANQEPLVPSAEFTAAAQEELALVCRTVQQVPPRCYEAFILRIVRGMPFEDVSREMKISSRMAKIYVARTLRSLQEELH